MFTWRGYKACISSQLPKLNNHELKRRFQLAMQTIKKMNNGDVEACDRDVFKKPERQSSSSGSQPQSSQQSSYSSSIQSSEIDDEVTQIPETQIPPTQPSGISTPQTQILEKEISGKIN